MKFMTILILAIGHFAFGAEESAMTDPVDTSLSFLSPAVVESLESSRFFFGHQSVGQDVLDGIGDLMATAEDLQLEIIRDPDPSAMTPGTIGHARVGGNLDPDAKIADFVGELESGLADSMDVAFLKFCYLDFGEQTDPEAVFSRYRDAMAELKGRHPHLTLVHFTVPLRPVQSGPKAWIKKLLGRPLSGREDNVVKNRYNRLLREHYEGREPVFDIAAIESTRLDGTRETFEYRGGIYFAMSPSYTPDDGHLNERGRRLVARELLAFLGSLNP